MKRVVFIYLTLLYPLAALTIQIDYGYDTTNFFNTAEKRSAMEAVAAFYGDLIRDQLLRIDQAEFAGYSWTAYFTNPASGNTNDIPNLVVPENTIIVFVGARNLSDSTLGIGGPGGWSASGNSDWFARIEGRGSEGAAVDAPFQTDFSPWGGSISFDADRTWNFSQSQNLSEADFVSVALHEMGHVLGIGTADSWDNQISGAVFTGAASTRSFGMQPPVQSGGGHFGGTTTTSRSFGSFNVIHGTVNPVLMLPILYSSGSNLLVTSDLDLSGLVDVGWQVQPRHQLTATALGPDGASFTLNSTSFFNYVVQRGNNLTTFVPGSGTIAGNGAIHTWADPSPPAGAAFYRLAATEVFPRPTARPSSTRLAAPTIVTTSSKEPRIVECGGECLH